MTPDDLLARLQSLVKAHRYSEVVELTMRHFPSVRAQLTPEQAVRLHEIMHVADADDVPEVQHPTKMPAAAQTPPSHRM
jgi:hypothetical protein